MQFSTISSTNRGSPKAKPQPMGKLVNFCAGIDIRNKPSDRIKDVLLNVPEHGSSDRRIENARKVLQSINYDHLLLDSGGYQILKAELKGRKISCSDSLPLVHGKDSINVTPMHVMKTAVIFQPDIVIGLDHPINPSFKTPISRQIEFNKKTGKNIAFAYESAMWHQKLCPQTKFFIPIQCNDSGQLGIIFNGLSGVAFDGVSMPIRNLSISEIVNFLYSFYQRDILNIHLLGTSRLIIIALCAFAARHLFKWVSIDSTTWNTAAIFSGFIHPSNLARIDLRPNGRRNYGDANECLCPYCCGRNFSEIKGFPLAEKRTLLRKHNWWVIDQAFKDLYAASTSLNELEHYLRGRARCQCEIDELIAALSPIEAIKSGIQSETQDAWESIPSIEKLSCPSQ
ncbi:MAG: hypothetical protein V2J65_32000 [Desulfobacteraceae bacterium]|jgi:queuine/archaeosine tRNA-ribosyltransferase|nr:hypothetical protein [Desulfobacteraceae bacterium]